MVYFILYTHVLILKDLQYSTVPTALRINLSACPSCPSG